MSCAAGPRSPFQVVRPHLSGQRHSSCCPQSRQLPNLCPSPPPLRLSPAVSGHSPDFFTRPQRRKAARPGPRPRVKQTGFQSSMTLGKPLSPTEPWPCLPHGNRLSLGLAEDARREMTSARSGSWLILNPKACSPSAFEEARHAPLPKHFCQGGRAPATGLHAPGICAGQGRGHKGCCPKQLCPVMLHPPPQAFTHPTVLHLSPECWKQLRPDSAHTCSSLLPDIRDASLGPNASEKPQAWGLEGGAGARDSPRAQGPHLDQRRKLRLASIREGASEDEDADTPPAVTTKPQGDRRGEGASLCSPNPRERASWTAGLGGTGLKPQARLPPLGRRVKVAKVSVCWGPQVPSPPTQEQAAPRKGNQAPPHRAESGKQRGNVAISQTPRRAGPGQRPREEGTMEVGGGGMLETGSGSEAVVTGTVVHSAPPHFSRYPSLPAGQCSAARSPRTGLGKALVSAVGQRRLLLPSRHFQSSSRTLLCSGLSARSLATSRRGLPISVGPRVTSTEQRHSE